MTQALNQAIAGYTIKRRFIPESVIPGKPLGRHVHHDSRSLAYLVAAGPQPTQPVLWTRTTAILDQGNLGSCTGNALCGCLGCAPFYAALATFITAGLQLNETEAVKFYSLATQLDSYSGTYPPTDTGSDGLSVAKAGKQLGFISGYVHMTSIDACKTAIMTAPFIKGSDWYTGMDNPATGGLVSATGTVRGGHEYLVRGYDPTISGGRWTCDNSWGVGFGENGSFTMDDATFTKLLGDDGDATQFIPINQPAPTPQPVPTPTPPVPSDPINANLVSAGNAWEKTILSKLTKAAKFKAAFDAWKNENRY